MKPPPRPLRHRDPDPPPDALVAEVLSFLAEDGERMERFLAASGLGVHDLRAAAATPAFAEGVLDHLCGDEALLVAFATEHDHDPAAIERVRQRLAPPPFDP